MGALLSLWRDLHEQRLAWAERAYEDFLKHLDPELSKCFTSPVKEISVVLYGKTQVGKTTLLLKLMGASPDVARILRGGQGKGRSATATATRYAASLDNSWRLTCDIHEAVVLSDAEIEEELRQLRRRVERGSFDFNRPVTIHIPLTYMDPQKTDQLIVNVLDLPGESPSNECESQHVRLVAQKYVPAADLILLVGEGDNLSFLKTESLPIPEIDDWKYVPERFRIITTFSTRSKSFKQYLKNVDKADKQAFRERIFDEIKTHDFEFPEDFKLNHLYPLEFGDSWHQLQHNEPDIYQKVHDVMEGELGIFNELHIDINNSVSRYSRIIAAAKIHLVAGRLKYKKIREFEKIESDIKSEASIYKGKCESIQKEICFRHSSTTAIENHSRSLGRKVSKIKDRIGLVVRADGKLKSIGENTQCMHDYLTTRHEEILSTAHSTLLEFELAHEAQDCFKGTLSREIDSHFDPVRNHLRTAYSINTYFPTFSDSHKKDTSRCREAVANAELAARKACIKIVDDIYEKCRKDANDRLKKLSSEIAGLESTLKNLRQKIAVSEEKNRHLVIEKEKFLERISHSIQQGSQFQSRLNEGFFQEVGLRKVGIMNESTPSKKFIRIASLLQMYLERQKLHVNPA